MKDDRLIEHHRVKQSMLHRSPGISLRYSPGHPSAFGLPPHRPPRRRSGWSEQPDPLGNPECRLNRQYHTREWDRDHATVTFDSTTIGATKVRFFVDADNDGVAGFFEPYVDSKVFYVMAPRIIHVNAAYSNLLNINAAVIQLEFNTNRDIGLRRDAADDYRSIINFVVDAATPFAITLNHWDSISDPKEPFYADGYFNAADWSTYNLTIVSYGIGRAGGVRGVAEGIGAGNTQVLVVWNAKSNSTLLHEFGHIAGLKHQYGTNSKMGDSSDADPLTNAPTSMHIMRSVPRQAAGANLFTQYEAKTYDGGN